MKRVYFIKPIGMDGPVKIGTSESPVRRCGALAAWSPFPLEIAAQVEGGEVIEARFHRLFIDSHERLEWFSWTPELQSIIDHINNGTFDIACLPRYAGKLATLKGCVPEFTDLDLEYVEVLRASRATDYRVIGFYRGHRPDPRQFARIKSTDRKRRIITDLREFMASYRETARQSDAAA